MTNLLFSHYKNKYIAAYLYKFNNSYIILFHNVLIKYLLNNFKIYLVGIKYILKLLLFLLNYY